jgi:hypothetical protein
MAPAAERELAEQLVQRPQPALLVLVDDLQEAARPAGRHHGRPDVEGLRAVGWRESRWFGERAVGLERAVRKGIRYTRSPDTRSPEEAEGIGLGLGLGLGGWCRRVRVRVRRPAAGRRVRVRVRRPAAGGQCGAGAARAARAPCRKERLPRPRRQRPRGRAVVTPI